MGARQNIQKRRQHSRWNSCCYLKRNYHYLEPCVCHVSTSNSAWIRGTAVQRSFCIIIMEKFQMLLAALQRHHAISGVAGRHLLCSLILLHSSTVLVSFCENKICLIVEPAQQCICCSFVVSRAWRLSVKPCSNTGREGQNMTFFVVVYHSWSCSDLTMPSNLALLKC